METGHHIDALFARLNDAAQQEVLRVAELPRVPRASEKYRAALSEYLALHRQALLPALLRTRDWPDADIEKLVREGALQIREPTRVKGVRIRVALGLTDCRMEGEASTPGGHPSARPRGRIRGADRSLFAPRLPQGPPRQGPQPGRGVVRPGPGEGAAGISAGASGRTYWPGAYRLFQIYERKPRTIAAAPFRDRVVHHAVMNRIEPPLDRTFIHDSYVCRRGKGVHAAVDRYQVWSRRNAYALKMDVAKYFPSIDHEILKEKLRRRIKDARVLALLDRIIDTSPPVNEPPVYFPVDDLLTPPGASQRDPHRQPDQPVPCQSLPRRPGPLREGGSQGGRLPALRR